MRITPRLHISRTLTMALHAPNNQPKLIFAPAGTEAHGQAEQFTAGSLHRRDLDPSSPIPQFHAWFTQAQRARLSSSPDSSSSSSSSSSSAAAAAVPHPETCTLSTASLPSGRVSARMVYLKELDATGGFVIYTNLGTSRKAADLATNPHASLVFWWEALQRQVRVEGPAVRIDRDQSQAYYDTRVRGSRIGAWASRQSQVLPPREGGDDDDDGRARLEEWVAEAEDRFRGQEQIPVPEFWGGLRIVPERVEFWQGRESRLHDRFVYEKEGEGWTLERLSP